MPRNQTGFDIFVKILVAPVVGVLLPIVFVVELIKTIFGIKGWNEYGAKMAETGTELWLMFLGAVVAAPFIYLFAMGLAGYGVLWATGGIALVTMIGGAALLLM